MRFTQIKKMSGYGMLLLIISCKTYTIPVDSFKKQMVRATSENLKEVEINNPLNYSRGIKYRSNTIERLEVVDKNGNMAYLDNSAAIEMRVTLQNGKKRILYFDTVVLENDTLKGGRSRFAQGLTLKIPMNEIVKIEVQDGGKKFNYQN